MSRREKKTIFRSSTLVALFIIFIMASGGMGFFLGGDETLKYDGHKFKRTDQGYKTKINGQTVFFSFLPAEVKDMEFSESIDSLLSSSNAVYVTYDPNTNLNNTMAQIQYDMEKALYPVTGIFLQRGLVNSSGYSIAQIGCENATSYMPVIELRQANSTSIVLEENCIVVQARSHAELVRAYNRLLYSAYDII